MQPRVGFLEYVLLYADLRQRLEPHVELRDLAKADQQRLAADIVDLDILIHHPRLSVTAAMIASAPRLRAVMAGGAGFDGIDVAKATTCGVLVTNQAGGNAEAVAEHAMGLVLALAKKIAVGDRHMRTGKPWKAAMFINNEIAGRTIGIIGIGAVGRRLAAIAAGGFSMRVVAADPFAKNVPDGVELLSLDEVLAQSDIIVVATPLDHTTRGLIGEREFARMKAGAILVNIARGHIVNQPALVAALEAGQVKAAGLDVFDDDVLRAGDPLLAFDNVIVTPHIAGSTMESFANKALRQGESVLSICRGSVPTTANIINPDAIAKFQSRFATTQSRSQP